MSLLTAFVLAAALLTAIAFFNGIVSMAHGGAEDQAASHWLMFKRVGWQGLAFLFILLALLVNLKERSQRTLAEHRLPRRGNMLKVTSILIAALFLAAGQPGFAGDGKRIVGVWRLVSFETEFQATGEREHTRGKNPTGFLIFTADGRMMAVLTNEARSVPKTEQDRAGLFNSMVAYTGTYRIEGDRWITKVDVAWNPALLGSEQPRTFRLEGDRLQEITPWRNVQPDKVGRVIVTWQRAN